MHYIATADTDIGISKDTNQDSVLIKHAKADGEEILLAVICDGMGGLSKGELASATVIRAFAKWFDEELPYELDHVDLQVIGAKWSLLLKELNAKILEYSRENGIEGVGTTFSGFSVASTDTLFVFCCSLLPFFIETATATTIIIAIRTIKIIAARIRFFLRRSRLRRSRRLISNSVALDIIKIPLKS